MNFQDKVRSMTAKEIIMAMVKALTKPPIVRVDMNTFGTVRRNWRNLFITPVCFGCAATNTICEISGIKFNKDNIGDLETRAKAVNSDYWFMQHFEYAIDSLRSGNVYSYNRKAKPYSFAQIKDIPGLELPILTNNYTKEDLDVYEKLANLQ